ncbi:hypothetical protein [Mycolicibacterium neoaurum]|uniref:hypothetical protein n=1 Tax=Mycolicibacterium neoaurum TaxID=1795 RepID=UPI001F4C6DC7|nr:hypothetical protein [Mycolicibacterium neoaurum]
MDIFESSIGILGLVSGGIGAWYGYRAYRYSKSAPYDERQAELRARLSRLINGQSRLVRAVKNLQHGLPGSPVVEDLEQLAYDLDVLKRHLIAPSPAHLAVIIKSIDDAVARLKVAQGVPRSDAIFIPHVEEIKCNVVRPYLKRALDNLRVLHDGLVEIERKPMSVRKQLQLFNALNPENQAVIEE